MEFMCRKDTQVKVRGFRVELGEIERHIRQGLLEVQQVIVDVQHGGEHLAASVCFSPVTSRHIGHSDMIIPMDSSLSAKFAGLKGYLAAHLPSYMVPSIYVPLRFMPLITSLKADREELRNTIAPAEMDAATLSRYMLAGTEKEPPANEFEVRMQGLWADVLGVSPDLVGRNDSFLQLGGESLAVIRLVTRAREQGIRLNVAAIFHDPRLSQVTVAAKFDDAAGNVASLQPWSLVPSERRGSLIDVVYRQCGLPDKVAVQDIYPVTALQEGLMALITRQPGAYISKYMFKLRAGIDLDRFKAAWEQTIQTIDSLRTRLVLHEGHT
jgi:aryl carrier-like protein